MQRAGFDFKVVRIIIDHHHKKGASKLDDKSRGGAALAGACANNLEVERV
ncbi:MAG: hypothetical protein QOG42_538, partial [Solirubrobacteraceae bacterium]|nr:hypothetical protein [Solirubrobacteraceae bacterium]